MNLRCGLYNAWQAILHEVDYPWVARAIRGWPGSATGPERSQAIHGSATGPEHIPKSYRPISLLSNVSKVFEKLMARRIAKAALRVKALSSTQFGAIENRSAIDALFAITHPAAEVLAIPTPSGRRNPPDRPTFLANDI